MRPLVRRAAEQYRIKPKAKLTSQFCASVRVHAENLTKPALLELHDGGTQHAEIGRNARDVDSS